MRKTTRENLGVAAVLAAFFVGLLALVMLCGGCNAIVAEAQIDAKSLVE